MCPVQNVTHVSGRSPRVGAAVFGRRAPSNSAERAAGDVWVASGDVVSESAKPCCSLGRKWPYQSSKIFALDQPPWAWIHLIGVSRARCRVANVCRGHGARIGGRHPSAFLTARSNTRERKLWGSRRPPSRVGKTSASSPNSSGRLAASSSRRRLESSTVRSRPVLVSPGSRPSDELRQIRASPRPKSTSIHRNANASPIRAPV